jgi:hypothetical protein
MDLGKFNPDDFETHETVFINLLAQTYGAQGENLKYTTKRITIERFFSSGFSRDFRTEISCFVPILRKIPVEWTNQNQKKGHKNCHHDPSPSTRFC